MGGSGRIGLRDVATLVAPNALHGLPGVRHSGGDAVDEAGDGSEHRLGLIPVRRVAAVLEFQQFDVGDLRADATHLLHRSVLVVRALDRQHRARDLRQSFLDVPAAELRREPDPVPAQERRVGVGMMARESGAQVSRFVRRFRSGDARDRDVLDHHVRRQRDDGGHGSGRGAGVDQCDRAAVAVPDQDRSGDRKPVEEIRQRDERLVVHVANGPGLRERIRISVAVARIDDRIAMRGLRNPVGKVLPPRDRPQSLVQEDERGAMSARDADPFVLDAMRTDGDEGHQWSATAEAVVNGSGLTPRSVPSA